MTAVEQEIRLCFFAARGAIMIKASERTRENVIRNAFNFCVVGDGALLWCQIYSGGGILLQKTAAVTM